MSIRLAQLLTDYNIPFSESGPEISRGWIGMSCPWCGDDKTHLGYNEEKDILTCWKCGPKRMFPTLRRLLGFDAEKVKRIVKKYGYVGKSEEEDGDRTFRPKEITLPSGFGSLNERHRKYLMGRGFDPDELVSRWGIMGSGLKDAEGFENRIIIPIHQNGKLVTFHSRDITGKARIPKKACRSENEAVPFKETLYGYDKAKGNTVIVTEGPFDVWRMGYGTVCTFGIKYTQQQLNLLSAFKNVFILFDSSNEDERKEERQAREQAERLADSLAIFQNVWIVDDLGSDPADMSQRKADAIARRLFRMAKEQEK